jgi:hypothetical protein
MLPHGKYLGERVGDPPKDEAEHFVRCPACGGWIDCRDLNKVFEHEGAPTPAAGSIAMTVVRTLRRSRVILACRVFGVAMRDGHSGSVGLARRVFDDCVARPLVGPKQEDFA